MAALPRISVITVCFNAQGAIEKTIQSVVGQTYENLEYLIIDGASKDGTMAIVDRYRDRIERCGRIVSEPDKGLYDAMNKGARLATGEWILYMNADDVFVDERVVEDTAAFIEKHPDAEVIYGNTEQILEHGIYTFRSDVPYKDHKIMFCHQSVFVRTDVLRTHPFDLRYRYAADYEQLSHFYLDGRKFFHLDRTIARMELRGGTTFVNSIASAEELYSIIASRGIDIEAERKKVIRHKKQISRFKSIIPAPLATPILRWIAKVYKPL